MHTLVGYFEKNGDELDSGDKIKEPKRDNQGKYEKRQNALNSAVNA